MKIHLYHLLLFTCIACGQTADRKQNNTGTNTAPKQQPARWNEALAAQFSWNDLADTARYHIYYLQLNFDSFPAKDFTGKTIDEYFHLVPDSARLLSAGQQNQLAALVNNPAHFSEGDCSTFHLNGGFIIFSGKDISAMISTGCGFNQWYFSPANKQSRYGSLSPKGFSEMQILLDNINK